LFFYLIILFTLIKSMKAQTTSLYFLVREALIHLLNLKH
jgi:hypothetical protein